MMGSLCDILRNYKDLLILQVLNNTCRKKDFRRLL